MPSPVLLSLVALALYAAYRAHAFLRPASGLRALPGPPSAHPLFGNMRAILKAEAGAEHAAWAAAYGPVLQYRAMFNRPRLMTTDVRALQHVLHRADVYTKPAFVRAAISGILGAGVLVAEGDAHRVQRKALNPAFGPGQLRALTGVMLAKAHELRDAWAALLAETDSVELEAAGWLSRCTLDIIGLAGFGYAFGALAGAATELQAAFTTIFGPSQPHPVLLLLGLLVPGMRHLPTKRNRTTKHALGVMNRIGAQLLAERKAAAALDAAQGEKRPDARARDLLSLLVRANTAADARERLSDADVLGQIPTFLLAGHETTSTLLSWILLELAAAAPLQARLRAELRTLDLPQDGDAPLDADTLAALERLPLLDAVVREALRLHAPVSSTLRAAERDDAIPLSRPFVDAHGVERTSVQMRQGDSIFVPMRLVNRSVELWGADALEFKPARWMDGAQGVPGAIPGVWGSTLAFLGGPHSCIGYKFSLHETKIILHALLCSFELELAVRKKDIEGRGGMVTRPRVRGAKDGEGGLPLRVRRAPET